MKNTNIHNHFVIHNFYYKYNLYYGYNFYYKYHSPLLTYNSKCLSFKLKKRGFIIIQYHTSRNLIFEAKYSRVILFVQNGILLVLVIYEAFHC